MIWAVPRQSASYRTTISAPLEILVSAVRRACSVVTAHKQIHTVESLIGSLNPCLTPPFPMCAQFVSFNSYRNGRVETKLSSLLFYLSVEVSTQRLQTADQFWWRRKAEKCTPSAKKPHWHKPLFMKRSRWKQVWVPGGEEEDYKDATVACQRTRTRSSCAHMHASHRILGGTSKGGLEIAWPSVQRRRIQPEIVNQKSVILYPLPTEEIQFSLLFNAAAPCEAF